MWWVCLDFFLNMVLYWEPVAALWRNTWACWWAMSWTWISNVPLSQRSAASQLDPNSWQRVEGGDGSPHSQPLWGYTWRAAYKFSRDIDRNLCDIQMKACELRDWIMLHLKNTERAGFVQPGEKKPTGDLSTAPNTYTMSFEMCDRRAREMLIETREVQTG